MRRPTVSGRLPAALTAAAAIALSACNTPNIVPEPGKITLKDALIEVGEGLAAMYEAGDEKLTVGLLPSEVEVRFNVSASATDSGSLFVEAGAPMGTSLDVTGVEGNLSTEITAERGNTITVTFTNILFAPPDTLLSQKEASELSEILRAIREDGGITILRDPPGDPPP